MGVVGLGYWGRTSSGTSSTARAPSSPGSATRTLVRSCRSDGGTRTPGAADFAEMLADPKLDAVLIATPISTHHALASAALAAGKHVWIEKPFASSSAEALDLAAAPSAQESCCCRATRSCTARP